MKRYLAFLGDTYYPERGIDDFAGDFDMLDEAIAALTTSRKTADDFYRASKWACVWDSETRSDVWNHAALPRG